MFVCNVESATPGGRKYADGVFVLNLLEPVGKVKGSVGGDSASIWNISVKNWMIRIIGSNLRPSERVGMVVVTKGSGHVGRLVGFVVILSYDVRGLVVP
jgi:hypothetical protein